VIEFPATRAVVRDMTLSPGLVPVDAARLRTGVSGMRAAIADGTLHHHTPRDVPAGSRSYAVEVVRAWAAGDGPDAQRRRCGVCSTWPVVPRTPA
jgi:hypothetical protein